MWITCEQLQTHNNTVLYKQLIISYIRFMINIETRSGYPHTVCITAVKNILSSWKYRTYGVL